jgi:hypothetical protein
MEIVCLKCKKEFIPGQMNTQIIGPDVEVSCPFCHDAFKGKLTSFVREQLYGDMWKPQSAHAARRMQRMARFMELNSSDYYKNRGMRHGKKKVRNIRD